MQKIPVLGEPSRSMNVMKQKSPISGSSFIIMAPHVSSTSRLSSCDPPRISIVQVAVSDGPTRPSGTAGSASGSVPSISPRMRVSNVEFAARRRPSASAYAIDETRRSSSLAAASALSAYPRGSFSMSASASMATAASATLPDLPMSSAHSPASADSALE